MKPYIILLATILLFAACAAEPDNPDSLDYDEETFFRNTPGRRTIIAYITADNNIAKDLSEDISEMVEGSQNMPSDCRLLVFADIKGNKPYVARLTNGTMKKVMEYDNNFYSTSPDSMRSIFQWIIDRYPSSEYGAVIEGHGSGPLIRKDTIASRLVSLHAYGYDATGDTSATSSNKWMNIPSMAGVFRNIHDQNGNAIKMSYLFFDCCCFQSVEVAYELRHAADYIVAPVCETPSEGADYHNMVPVLCHDKSTVAHDIVTTYATDSRLCISAVRTDRLDDLCNATQLALREISKTAAEPLALNKNKCIYYYRSSETATIPLLCDMKHIIKTNATPEVYNQWLPYLENVVVTKHRVSDWATDANININFRSFSETMTDDNYGGISMLIPDEAFPYYGCDINTTMFQLQWCRDLGWKQFGW